MQHVAAILIAFATITAAFGITLGVIGGAGLMQVVIAAAVLVAIAYPVGDLLVLPATTNLVGTAVDFVTAGLVVWLTVPAVTGGVLLLSALGVAVGVYFFHKYLYTTVLRDRVPNR